jgi:hypothetical protein
MLDCVDRLADKVKNYRTGTRKSIFREISGYYYRENYHSDILAYYLKDALVRKCFINWLNDRMAADKNDHPIAAAQYSEGEIAREQDHIDILLYSNGSNYSNDSSDSEHKKRAIIIENKSNDADDQYNQIFRYYKSLKQRKIEVDAIFYLNKSTLKGPDLSALPSAEKSEIEKLLVIGQLTGKDGFCENVIEKVLIETTDIRLNALSQEIRDLFYAITYGDVNMEDLEEFVKELSQGNNLEELKQAVKAYHDLPKYFAQKCKAYLDEKRTGFKVWLWRPDFLVIETLDDSKKITANFVFSTGGTTVFLGTRGQDKSLPEEFVSRSEEMKSLFKRDKNDEHGRYETSVPEILDFEAHKRIIDALIKALKEYTA